MFVTYSRIPPADLYHVSGSGLLRCAARLALAALAVFLAAPYIAAELGFFLDRVPVLGSLFITGAIRPEPGDGLRHAVHHGHHHGMDGLILTLSALLLSRQLGAVARPW